MSYRNFLTPNLQRLAWVFLSSLVPVIVTPSAAAPGPITQIPLFFSSVVEPNIMLLVDNSGSMNNVVPDVPYDPDVTYFSCPSSRQISTSNQVDIRIESDGDPYFDAGPEFDWGITSGNGRTGRTKRCFNPTADYTARLHGNSGSSTKSPGSYLPAQYAGNYLNWYFGCASSPCTNSGSQAVNFGSGARLKPDTKTRMLIAQNAAKKLVNSLTDVRIGLSSYDGSSGARINVGIDDINANLSTLIGKIDALDPSGSTPLAESLHEIGRYFVGFAGPDNPGNQTSISITSNGEYEGNLILHPGKTNETSRDDDTVFNRTPVRDSGVSGESPILYWCQQNFAVLLTDGRPQSDQDITSSTGLTDYDGDCTSGCLSDDRKPGREYESAGSDYLDDVALALFEMDLRPDIDNFEGEEVTNNVITYTIGFADDQVINDPLMQDTADNGGGLFITAANATALQQAFTTALDDIYNRTGSAAAVTFNSSNLSTDSVLYLALFNGNRWSGQLLAFPLDGNTGAIGSTPDWDAAAVLDNRNLNSSPRTILTYDGSDGIPFRWNDLTILQKADLCVGPETGGCSLNNGGTPADPTDDTITGTTTTAQARLDFLRGDRSNEGQGLDFRVRGSRLGDIVHSGPVFVGKPELDWPDTAPFPTAAGETYSDFEAAQANRTEVVYVGANDGMLHGFRASNGEELLGYIPHNLFSTDANEGLHFLTDPDYFHRFYVDLKPTISDAYVTTSSTGSVEWHTILIGGEGAGGRGYFALDITDPVQFSEINAEDIVIWEFSSEDDADLGHTFSTPTVALMENGRWAAVFGNGFEDGGSGEAQLFILYLDGGLDGAWTEGTDYIKISTEVGDTGNRNGLATPAVVDIDGNGAADRAYAGDLRGNMWAFDMSGSNDASWGVAYRQGRTPKPLFTGAGNQAVTSEPIVVKHPTVTDTNANSPNVMILFGTGQFIVDGDKTTTHTQSFYGVWDEGTDQLTRSDLVEQTVESGFPANLRVLTDNPVPYTASGSGQRFGWFFDLPDSGERVVVNPEIRGPIVFFNTLTPSDISCDFGGSGWLMALDIATGGRPDSAPFDVNGDDVVDENDLIETTDSSSPLADTPVAVGGEKILAGLPAESAFLGNKQYTPDTSTTTGEEVDVRALQALEDEITGRLSWEELLNF